MHGSRDARLPTLQTQRLRLRPFVAADASQVVELAGAREIADTTFSIPHPYPLADAKRWIASHTQSWDLDQAAHFAITLLPGPSVIGAVSLRDINRAHFVAELAIWIGKPWWGNGYALEAVRAMLHFGFTELGLNRVHAHHLVRNPASGKVLESAGFHHEGVLRQAILKWGRFEDVALLAILRSDPSTPP